MNELPMVTPERLMHATLAYVPRDAVRPGWSWVQALSIARAYRALVAGIVFVVLLATALAVALWPRTYTATASVMVNYEVNDPQAGKELPVGQVGSYIATQVELMQTPEVLLTVVDRLALAAIPEYARGWRADAGTRREWVAMQVARSLAVFQSQRGSQIIYVTFSADDPQRAAQVANAVVDVYGELEATRAAGPPTDRAQRYAAQVESLKLKVDQAQQRVTAFHQRNGLVDGGAKSTGEALQLSTLNERLLAAQSARRAADARAAQPAAVSDEVLASTEAQALKTQLGTQEQRLAQLSLQFTPAHPDVRDATLQVETTRRAVAATIGNYRENALANRNVAVRLEQGLQAAVQDQRVRMLARSQLEDEAAKTLLELESAQAVYRRALDAGDPMLGAPRSRFANVSPVSRALPPVRASKPRVLLMAALGIAAAFVLGLGVPALWERFHRRVRCRDDLERDHGVPVLVEFGRLPVGAA